MHEFRWPIIVTTAILAMALFFGINYYRQRYFQEEPFLETLEQMESIAEASIIRENGDDILELTPSSSYHDPLQDLVLEIQDLAAEQYKKPLEITVKDRRSAALEAFARSVTPDLYEGALLANYRSVADSVHATASIYQLEEVLFTVDFDRLYLQARDGDGEHYLYMIIPLNPDEGGAGT